MKKSIQKLTALFMSMCMAVSVVTSASVSTVSAAGAAVEDTVPAEEAVVSAYGSGEVSDGDVDLHELSLGSRRKYYDIKEGESVYVTFYAPEDMCVMFEAYTERIAYAEITLSDSEGGAIASKVMDPLQDVFNYPVNVKKGEVYTASLNYRLDEKDVSSCTFRIDPIIEVEQGEEIDVNSRDTYYRYIPQKDSVLYLNGERSWYYCAVYDENVRFVGNSYVLAGKTYYIRFVFKGVCTIQESTAEINLNGTADILVTEYNMESALIFKPKKDTYVRYYAVNDVGSATSDEPVSAEVKDNDNEYIRTFNTKASQSYNDDFDFCFSVKAGKTYSLCQTVNDGEKQCRVALEECAPYVFDNGVLIGDMTGPEAAAPSRYYPPFNRDNPGAYFGGKADDAVEVTEIAYPTYARRSDIISVKVPDTVKKISKEAFQSSEKIKSVTLNEGLEVIGERAFTSCTGLESISIPDSVKSIEKYAFCDCKSLKSIRFPSDLDAISKSAFSLCESLEEVTIPSKVKKISDSAFQCCTSLSNLVIPQGVETIENKAFMECPSLTSVTIPESVTKIGGMAFGYSVKGRWDKDRDITINDKYEDFVIRGYKGTEAERYANANGFKFVEVQRGDADGDGVIDSRDRVCLTRHLAKWAGYEDIDEKAADVNADGKVDTKDRIVLARHIAKWKSYESLPYKG